MPDDEKTLVPTALLLILRYCVQQGWVPVGQRTFDVGDWLIRINGEEDEWRGVPPHSALVLRRDRVGWVVASPRGGEVHSYPGCEADFLAAMKAVLP